MILSRTISLHNLCKLVVLFCMAFSHCSQPGKNSAQNISIIWQGNRAVAISIPLDLTDYNSRDSIGQNLIVQKVPYKNKGGIAGDYEIKEHQLIFTPLIPFTRGSKYLLISRNKSIAEIAIPPAGESPTVLAIYPGMDSLPENLLKFYIRFSKPMAE